MKKIIYGLMAGLVGLSFISFAAEGNEMQEMSGRSGSNTIVIIFDGEPETTYKASLKIFDQGQVITHEIESAVPSEYRYQGEALEAIVQQMSREGALTMEVRKGGNISRSSTKGKNSEMRLNIH